MKSIFLLIAGLALCSLSVPAAGTTNALGLPGFQSSSEQPTEATKTFTGTVAKQGQLYVLTDKANKTNYQLDDPKKVSAYEGKNVKVTGTLDAENLIIHVQTITVVA